ncbi:hypothetical protein AVEN_141554-1 [Araneus ventricosus]|uniref:Uncharacterized protein n=1 Tax=Araneus ventricosus TaxID=182803 RepID=A0A4Y2T732_ARAVE|nr:hypothetical protein AVEN_141554-1 [Araneus ventricosus]
MRAPAETAKIFLSFWRPLFSFSYSWSAQAYGPSKSVPRTSGHKIWWVIHSRLYPRVTRSYGIGLAIGAVQSTVPPPHAAFKTGPPCPNFPRITPSHTLPCSFGIVELAHSRIFDKSLISVLCAQALERLQYCKLYRCLYDLAWLWRIENL